MLSASSREPSILIGTKNTAGKIPPKSVDEYIAGAPPDKRSALRTLRRAIKAAAPGAAEYIGYGMAGYKHKGKALIYFAYSKEHVGLYGGALVKFTRRLKGHDVSKGTIRFAPRGPIPEDLIGRIVKDRVAEIDKST